VKVALRAAIAALLLAGIGAPAPTNAAGTAYPTNTVRIIVGFQPGGSVDQMGRFFAKRFQETLGGTFIVENRPGASGNIAADLVAKAKPDGSTLLVTSVVHSINPSLFTNLGWDPVKDFSAVSPVALAPNGIMVNPSAPYKNLHDLIAAAKAHPGQISYADSGVGTMMNLGMEMFEKMAGVKLTEVPYPGTGPALTAVVGGQVPVLSSGYGSAEAMVHSGKLRLLAISTSRPSSLAPGAPTVAAAAALKGYEAVSWIGIFAPPNTPRDVVDKLNAAVKKIEEDPQVGTWMATQGLERYWLPAPAFGDVVKADVGKYGKLIHDLDIKPE
jgi:tripartite-type tricarboxylate transporter receptor subunit TctC